MKTEQRIEEFKRDLLRELLEKCTETQRHNFVKYFCEPESLKPEKLDAALSLCERTIKQNEMDRIT